MDDIATSIVIIGLITYILLREVRVADLKKLVEKLKKDRIDIIKDHTASIESHIEFVEGTTAQNKEVNKLLKESKEIIERLTAINKNITNSN